MNEPQGYMSLIDSMPIPKRNSKRGDSITDLDSLLKVLTRITSIGLLRMWKNPKPYEPPTIYVSAKQFELLKSKGLKF